MESEDDDGETEGYLHSPNSQTWKFNNVERKSITTLSQWIMREESLNYCTMRDISQIVISMMVNFKMIYDYLITPKEFRWRLRFSTEGKSIREIATILLTGCLSKQKSLFALVIDTMEQPIFLSEDGSYIMYIVPLEGDCEGDVIVNPVGSLLSIYKRPPAYKGGLLLSKRKQVLCRGVEILLSIMIVYGKFTTIIITDSSRKVLEFQLDNIIGEFILFDGNVVIPKEGNVYYVDEKNSQIWDKKMCQIIYSRKITDDGRNCFFRLLGSKCHTVYKILRTGGLYALTGCTVQDMAKLLFEANPFTHILRAAGGLATTGLYSPLEIYPQTTHDKVALYAGSRHEIEYVVKLLNFERSFH